MIYQINTQSLTLLSQTVDNKSNVKKPKQKHKLSLKNTSIRDLLSPYELSIYNKSKIKTKTKLKIPNPSAKPDQNIKPESPKKSKRTYRINKTD